MAVLDESCIKFLRASCWLVIFCKDLLHEIVEQSEVPHEEHELPRVCLSGDQFESVLKKVVIQLSDKVDCCQGLLQVEFKLSHSSRL